MIVVFIFGAIDAFLLYFLTMSYGKLYISTLIFYLNVYFYTLYKFSITHNFELYMPLSKVGKKSVEVQFICNSLS